MELKMTNSQVLCFLFACLIVLTSSALPLLEDRDDFSLEKKSNLNEFMSAMKGAGRLRYGKRMYNELIQAVPSYQYILPQRPIYKRMAQNLPELIDTLNGAERLRFGRK